MRFIACVVALAMSVGCGFGVKTCSTDADCVGGGVCSPTEKICLLPGDGGATGGGGQVGGGSPTGGGSVGGGGGSVTGGGTGGGAVGGGGGTVDLCMNVTCPTGYACDATTGDCTLRVTGVRWLQPAGGLTNDAGTQLVARLTTTATVSLPTSLTYSEADGGGGALMVSGGDYVASVQLSEGMHALLVKADFADAGFTDRVTVNVDLTAPTVTGTLPTTAKRDDVLEVSLNGPTDLAIASVVVKVNEVPMQQSTSSCSAPAGCWRLDLSAPAMDKLTDTFTVTASASDTAGNSKTSIIGMVTVSRVRWELTVTTDSIRAAPAVGVDGTIYVGSTNTNTNGSLYAIGWDGGSVAAPVALGAMQSVATAVSNDAGVVFYTMNDLIQGRVGARNADLSTAGLQAQTAGNLGTQTFSSVGLVAKAGAEVGAVAAFNLLVATPGSVVVYGSASTAKSVDASPSNVTDFAPVPTPLETPNNIIVNGTDAYLMTRPGGAGLHRQTIQNVNLTPTLGVDVPLATSGSAALCTGQSWTGSESVIGGYGALTLIYRLGATAVSASGDLTAPNDNGMSAIASNSKAFVGRGNSLVAYSPATLAALGTDLSPASGAGTIRTSPILGKARPTQTVGLGYAVNSSGRLMVFSQNAGANGSTDWGNVFSNNQSVLTHATLDCNRRLGAATATTGLLYIASGAGKMVAIIVDSPKLDDTALWPKYQRTAGNAGNPDAVRFPLNPGCP